MSSELDNLVPEILKITEKPTKKYHVGILPSEMPPAWNVTLAGVSFPVTSSRFDDSDNEFKLEGQVVDLNTDQIKAIKEAISFRVVRWRKYPSNHRTKAGKVLSAEIWDVRTNGFSAERGDEPLVKYLYFKPAPEDMFQPALRQSVMDELDKAITSAMDSEDKAATDPKDAATREQHKQLKRLGGKVEN